MPRHSSIWDRVRGDETTITQEQFTTWQQANFPGAPSSGRSWKISLRLLSAAIVQFDQGDIPTAQAVKEIWSLTQIELDQLNEILTGYIQAGGAGFELKLARLKYFESWLVSVEQNHRTNKAEFYTKFAVVTADGNSD